MTVDQIKRAQVIISGVIKDHKIHKDDFFSASREPHLVAARIDAAKRLRENGFKIQPIATSLKRSPETIGYYLYPKIKKRKAAAYAAKYPLEWLDPDARQVVCEYAAAEETSPRVIIAQWIADRARYEASQREAA